MAIKYVLLDMNADKCQFDDADRPCTLRGGPTVAKIRPREAWALSPSQTGKRLAVFSRALFPVLISG